MENYQQQILLCRALQKLDKALEERNVEPFTLNVCGGFALLLQQIRTNGNIYTDIDYIGDSFSEELQSVIQQIGQECGFGTDWINNDILVSGYTLEDIQYTTGSLRFEPKMELAVIQINALCKEDLLKMKVIAIDTALMSIEFGGEFTRTKDFNDIYLLAKDLEYTIQDIKDECDLYVLNTETFEAINYYFETQDTLLFRNTYTDIIQGLKNYENLQLSETKF